VESSARHKRSDSNSSIRKRTSSAPSLPSNSALTYDPQLSLFVIFEKKAGWIRLVDSAVGEVELYDKGVHTSPQLTHSTLSPTSRRQKSSFSIPEKETKGVWVPPERIELPLPPSSHNHRPSKTVHILTRGRYSHIVPSPRPASLSASSPLYIASWESIPFHITARLCTKGEGDSFLQLVALGEDGVEVQELSLSFLNKGKGKARAEEVRRSQVDVGGSAGVLCGGGHWHRPRFAQLSRTDSIASETSFDILSSEEIAAKLQVEQGIYGWCRKGLEDWRVFWVGGDGEEEDVDDDDEGA
jgi:hypothetical protein